MNDPHVPKDIEVVITMDDGGETPIGDPSKDRLDYVFHQRVPEMHDGLCEGMRYKTAFSKNQGGLRRALHSGLRKFCKRIETERYEHEKERRNHGRHRRRRVKSYVGCKSGRHRAVILADEAAKALGKK